jgi:hypothetical protein
MTDTFAPRIVKGATTDDVQAMKDILKSINDVNEQVPTFDVNMLLNQLVDAVLDLPEADYERFGKKFADLFTQVVEIRKGSHGEPFLILKAGELGEHVPLNEFRRYEASAALHHKINEVLVKTGVRPSHNIPQMTASMFSVVRRVREAPPEQPVDKALDNYEARQAREVAEFNRLQDIVNGADVVSSPLVEPQALTLAELSGLAPETTEANTTPVATNNLEVRVNNLEAGIRQLLEAEAKNLETRMLERKTFNEKLDAILALASGKKD